MSNFVGSINAGGQSFIHVGNIYNNYVSPAAVDTTIRRKLCLPFQQNHDIVDRKALFDELGKLLPPSTNYQSAALWGLSGSGKTQIALEFAYRHSCRDSACSIFWVHADTKTSFLRDYEAIGRTLGVGWELQDDDVLAAVRQQIEREPSWMLIIDNADDIGLLGIGQGENISNLHNFIPYGLHGTVLWISRDKYIAENLVDTHRAINVPRMTDEEAMALLEKGLSMEIGDAIYDSMTLFAELDWLPLTISQAASHMQRKSMSIKDYLSQLGNKKKRVQLFRKKVIDKYRWPRISNSILEILETSIDHIERENDMADDILHILAFLDSKNISFELIEQVAIYKEKHDCNSAGQDDGDEDSSRNDGDEDSSRNDGDEDSFRNDGDEDSSRNDGDEDSSRNDGDEDSEDFSGGDDEDVDSSSRGDGDEDSPSGDDDGQENGPGGDNDRKGNHLGGNGDRKEEYGDSDSKNKLLMAITRLRELSFLSPCTADEQFYEMPKIVQEAARYNLRGKNDQPDYKPYCSKGAFYVVQGLYSAAGSKLVDEYEGFPSHARQAAEWAGLWNGGKEPFELLTVLSNDLSRQERWQERELVNMTAYKLAREFMHKTDLRMLETRYSLAESYSMQEKYNEAEEAFAGILSLCDKEPIRLYDVQLKTMRSLAKVYYMNGKYKECDMIRFRLWGIERVPRPS